MKSLNLNRGILRVALLVLLTTLGIGNAWAGGSSSVTVYATANVQPSTTGRGKVYVGKSTTSSPAYKDDVVTAENSTSSTSSLFGTESKNISFYCYAQVTTDGYYFKGWSETNSESATAISTNSPYTYSISTNNTSSPGTTKTLYALFVPIAISNPSPVTYNSTSLTETKTWTIDFTHTGGDRQEDFRNATISSTSGDGQWTVTNTQYVNTTTVRVTCTYTASRDQYTNSAGTRTDEAMLSLSSAGGESTGSTTISVQFPEVTISDATGDAALIKDNASDVKSGSVVFPVEFAESIDNFATPTITKTSGEGTWAITSYSYSANTVTINYSHTGSGTYGTRASEATITLSAKTGGASQSVNVTASYPSVAITSAEDSKAYTPSLLTDGPGVATFYVSHADGLSDFVVPTEITPIDEGGTWTIGETTYTQSSEDPSQGTVQVNYTYNSGGYVGTRTAELTLSASSGATLTLTLSGVTEPESTNDASVTPAGGSPTEYATFAEALAAANGLTGSTLKLLRNVDLGTITATNNITKAMTIDLNGKELRAAVNATSVGILTITKAVAVTIKDSKTGGKIINEIARNSEIRTIFVNKAGATLTLESGTIAVNNLGQYASAANADLGVAKYANCAARAINQCAGSTVNINGGRVEALGTRNAYGIYQESSVATNNEGTSVLNISGGEVYAEAPYGVYGINGYGKINFSNGDINVKINTNMVDARYAADHANNAKNGLAYGILVNAYSNATASKCYFGTLDMTGGNVNVTNERVLAADLKSYGVLINCSNANMGSGTAVDGSKCQKAAAKGSIDGGTITVNSGTYYSFGVYMSGSYNSYDNTSHVLTVKNCAIDVKAHTFAYGVFSQGAVNTTNGGCYNGDIELTNCTVTAETTVGAYSYAAFVTSRVATIYKNASADAANYYHGEYGSAGKLTINSGTYKAYAKTTTAYCVSAGNEWSGEARARTTYADETNVALTQLLGGNVEAYPTLIIHGGDFYAETFGTTTARAVSSGGYTTIDGGTFKAVAKTKNAYGLAAVSGTMKATGVTVKAEGNETVYGVLVNAGISDYTLFDYSAEVELNNCDITATTRTGTEARGVSVVATTKTQTEATKETLKTNGTKEGATSTQKNNYNNYYNIYQIGEKAVAAKVKINGGTYRATAATTTAYGVVISTTAVSATGLAHASAEGDIKNAKFIVKTNGTTTAYGVWAGGPTTIDGCDITVHPQTSTAYGIYANDQKTTITNTKLDLKGTATAHGFYANAQINGIGWDLHGEFELGEGNDITVAATDGNAAHVMTLIAAKKNIASGDFAGDYVTAASAHVTGGTYKATATGTTSYVLNLSAEQVQGSVSAAPSCTIEGGKFWAMADGGTTGICSTNGVIGSILFKGGFYNVNTTLSKHIPEGYEEFPLPNDRPEYTEGYRYAIEPVGNHGNYVCQIGSTKYKTLEEALQAANSGNTILMIANYTLSAGDWILKSGVKLLVPYSGQTSTKETNLEVVEGTASPTLNIKLSFAEGAHLVCNGIIEAGAKQTGQGSSELTGQVYGSYGHIYMAEGSSITIESGATLYAWGYVTGKGEITIKNGGKSYEMFQFGWYKGGNTTSSIYSNRSSYKIFPMTDYSYQNIECPIMYYPGASAYGRSAVKPSSYSSMEKPLAMLVGTADNCMFKMTTAEASANTWVKKVYDPETDITNWIMNSGAAISGISMSVGVTVNSADFYLPITSNFRITLNYGDMNINNDVIFLPGSQLIINKEATGILKSGKLLFFYDAEDWFTGLGHVSVTASGWSKAKTCGYYYYPATYSPTWNTANPRKNVYARDKASIDKGVTPLPDAELFVHGKMIVNGSLYTSGDGNASSIGRNANIHSTNEDAGKIQFNTKVTGSKALYKVCFAVGNSEANNSWSDMIYGGQTTAYPAHLANGDGTYVQSSGTEAGKQYVYVDNQWQCWEENGCYTYDAQNHPYAKPAAYVQLTTDQPDANHLLHDAATGTRNFVWDQNCYWWEVVTTPTDEGYYQSINPDYNGKYNYYYYDGSSICWKIKKITVTWNIEGSTTNYSVGYGTKPEWYGGTPSKTSSSSNYYYIWDGWIVPESETPLANSELPEVTADITFTAHFYEKYYEYNITFKNDDGTILESKNWIAGTTPSYEGTPTKNPTAAETYEFNGTWNPSIVPVSGSATYVANYTSHPRAYTITFLNYDMSVLGTAEVVYNGTPSNATYLAAVAPVITDPYKPDNNAFSFEFSGWRLQGASGNGFTQVKGDQTYVAQYVETTKKYRIAFLDDDGETVLYYMQLPYDADIVYDGPDPTTFAANKTNDEWCYTFTGWAPEPKDKVDGPQTYVATYKKRSNLVLDITDWTSSQVTLNTTNWALGGWPYTVNGTKYSSDKRAADRTLTIDYSGNPNKMLTIEVYNVNGELYSMHSYTIPYVFETSSTLQSVSTSSVIYASSVIYVNGGSLTINNETEVNAIYVASCAELIVNSPLTVSKLVLRTKETEAASLENNSTISATNTYYTRQVSDMAFHQFALPLGVSSTDDVFLSSRAACPYGKTWLLKSYSESERAKNGMGAESNWQEVPDKSPIEASVGYELYSGSAFYREFYFPVNLAEVSKEKKVAVGYTSNASAGADNAGWNLLCSPLLGKFEQTFDPNNPEDGIKISQWIDGHYEQPAPPVIYPAVPFYYQAKETGKSLYFTGDKMIVYAPRNSWNTAVPTQWLQLTIHNQYGDKLDETSIYTHPEKFSMNYESGYDVAKQSIEEGNALIYSELSYGKLAFAAVPDSIAETRIPLTAYVAAEGEYVFSMVESNYLGRLQYVFLHDTQAGLVTDLLERDYAVKLAQGTNAGRFYIQCVFAAEAPAVTTGVNSVESNDDAPQKIMYKNKVYIIYQGRVYDMTGRQCELK